MKHIEYAHHYETEHKRNPECDSDSRDVTRVYYFQQSLVFTYLYSQQKSR